MENARNFTQIHDEEYLFNVSVTLSLGLIQCPLFGLQKYRKMSKCAIILMA